MKTKSTPRSCTQKKSSVYKSSKSSSSRTIGTNIGSGNKLNESITPLINWDTIDINIKNPKIADVKWYLIVKILK